MEAGLQDATVVQQPVRQDSRPDPPVCSFSREHDLLTDLVMVSTQTAEPDMSTEPSLRGGFFEE